LWDLVEITVLGEVTVLLDLTVLLGHEVQGEIEDVPDPQVRWDVEVLAVLLDPKVRPAQQEDLMVLKEHRE